MIAALLAGLAWSAPSPRCPGAEDLVLPTEDGASIGLHHHKGSSGPPVLVVHGLSSNHRSWDLMPDRSLAEELLRAGLDPWLLDLRGHGLARQGQSPRGWSIDDYGRYDIPAAIAHIRQATGAERVGYVGHSMGGMVAAPYLHHHGQGALWGLVIVASPYDFRGDDDYMRLARRAMKGGGALPAVHGDQAGRLAAGWEDLPTRLDELIWARGSVGPEAQSLALRGALSPMYRGELGQLAEQLGHSPWSSLEGVDWLQSAASWRLPLLVLAGRGDRIAPPDRVRPLYEQAGSADKSWLLYGRAQGHSHDYGHVDLLLGEEAGREVLPQISAWLAARAPLPPPDPAGPMRGPTQE